MRGKKVFRSRSRCTFEKYQKGRIKPTDLNDNEMIIITNVDLDLTRSNYV